MKAKLIKTEKGYHLDTGSFDGIHLACYPHDVTKQRLSLKNCQAIERGYDLNELAKEECEYNQDSLRQFDSKFIEFYKEGFQKALELMGDKKFSENEANKIWKAGQEYWKTSGESITFEELIERRNELLQQTEWEVEIEMQKVKDETKIVGAVKGVKGSGNKITTYKSVPKLDADGCLILKRI